MENTEIKEKKPRSAASRKADKTYNKKKTFFTITYTPIDQIDADRLNRYIVSTGKSKNTILKEIIKSYLDSKNFY